MNKREFTIAYVLARAGLVEKFNGVASVTRAGEIYDAIHADTDEGCWQEWRGEKPYPEGRVEVQMRSGAVWVDDADGFVWAHDDVVPESEIVAWRPARD